MGFSDKDRILIKNLYIFTRLWSKKKLLKELPQIGTAGTEQTSEKAARNLHSGRTKWQH